MMTTIKRGPYLPWRRRAVEQRMCDDWLKATEHCCEGCLREGLIVSAPGCPEHNSTHGIVLPDGAKKP